MSNADLALPDQTLLPLASRSIGALRSWLVVVGVAIGLIAGFTSLFFATLPFFLLPLIAEFGWSRTQITSATVLAMLGAAVGAPLAGSLFRRFGTERVIGASIVLFAAGLLTLAVLPANVYLLGAICFIIGLVSSGTTVVGYMSVLPKWFDGNLGLALGCGGVGAGVGVGLAPFLATGLIVRFGWRGAYAGLAVLALGVGLVAWALVSVRGARARDIGIHSRATDASQPVRATGQTGTDLRTAMVDWRFWLLMLIIFLTTSSILGTIVHGATLATERGLPVQQVAIVASLAGVGGLTARIVIGALLDRFFAPAIAAVIFALAATGLYINATATTFPVILSAAALSGFAFGAEGDLIPFFVRRYFGTTSFGIIFGVMYVAYTLGGVAGPIAYGIGFDRTAGYEVVMQIAAAACAFCALAVLALGPYRYRAADKIPRRAAA